MLCDHGRGDIRLLCSGSEAAEFNDPHEDRHAGESVHYSKPLVVKAPTIYAFFERRSARRLVALSAYATSRSQTCRSMYLPKSCSIKSAPPEAGRWNRYPW